MDIAFFLYFTKEKGPRFPGACQKVLFHFQRQHVVLQRYGILLCQCGEHLGRYPQRARFFQLGCGAQGLGADMPTASVRAVTY